MLTPLLKEQIVLIVQELIKQNIAEELKRATEPLPLAGISERELSVIEQILRLQEGQKNILLQMDLLREQMEKRFEQVDKRFEAMQLQMDKRFEAMQLQIEKRFEQVDKRFEQVEKRFEQVDKRFEQVDKRFEQVDKRFEQVDKRFEQVDKKLEDLNRQLISFMKWSFGVTVTVGGLIITILKFIL